MLAEFDTFNPASFDHYPHDSDKPAGFDDHPHDSEISPRIRLLLAITNYALSTQTFRAVRWDDASLMQHHCFGMVFFALRALRIHVTDYAAMLSFREALPYIPSSVHW